LLRRSISERFTQTANSQSRVGAHGDRCKRVLASFQLWGRQREFYDDYLSAIGSASTLRADIVSGEASWLPSRAPLTAAAYEAELAARLHRELRAKKANFNGGCALGPSIGLW